MDTILASPIIKSFVAGSLSGACSTLLFQPLDLVKTRLQAQATTAAASSLTHSERIGMVQTMGNVIKNDHILGLWKGLKPSIIRCVPGVGMYFSSLNMLKSHFFGETSPVAHQSLILGASARTLSATALIPFTVIKTRFESGSFKYSGVGNALYSIYTLEGRKGLAAGLSATLIRDAPFSGLYLMFYSQGKSMFSENVLNGPHRGAVHFVCGICAGVWASVLTQPADVIKTKMQLSAHKYSLKVALVEIYKNNGIEGFFRGLAPRVLRRTLISAMGWTVFEEIMKYLNLKT